MKTRLNFVCKMFSGNVVSKIKKSQESRAASLKKTDRENNGMQPFDYNISWMVHKI